MVFFYFWTENGSSGKGSGKDRLGKVTERYLNREDTMLLFCLTLNVGFTTESAEVVNTCLVGKTILNEYSIQLAFTPHLSLFLLDLS